MKALLFGLLWVAPGLWLALSRTSRPPAERVLSVLFWPFFLAVGDEEPTPAEAWAPPPGPLARLHQALGADDAATAVVLELHQAVGRLEARLSRMDQALAQVHVGEGREGLSEALVAARTRSAELLRGARARCGEELDAALAAVEETATRLVIARETGTGAEVTDLLASLRSRLHAAEEVAAMAPGTGALEDPELRVVG